MSNLALRYLIPLTMLAAGNAPAATFVVDTTSDATLTTCTDAPDNCSLRGAVVAANALAGADLIHFNIPLTDGGCVEATGVCRITLVNGSLSVVSTVTIDGYTQPGAIANTNTVEQGGMNGSLRIELVPNVIAGNNAGFVSSNVAGITFTLRGLALARFATALSLIGNSTYNIEGNYFGTDAAGNVLGPRQSSAIAIAGQSRIGGTEPAQRNLISNSNIGINVFSIGVSQLVQGNLIGTDLTGTLPIPNDRGIDAGSNNLTIGGSTPGSRNVISGNLRFGITQGSGATMVVRGNFIGTDVTGTLPLGNGTIGVQLSNSASGLQPSVGGFAEGDANTIAFNGTQGVAARGQLGNIARNRIFRNGQFGISLRAQDSGAAPGRLANDAGDGDNTANKGQNFPAISAYAVSGSNVDLSYSVDSAPANSTYPLRIEFFKADGDEGRDFIGSDEYIEAEAQTDKAISLPIPVGLTLGANDIVVATATDAQGNTSEFSFDIAAVTILADGPDPSPSGTSYQVDVEVLATTGAFRPNGAVSISDGRGGSCEASLTPAAEPLRSTGSCLLSTGGVAGGITLTAVYSTFRHAFATATGSSPQATEPHTLGPPPPEQVTFERCVQSVSESDGTASVRVNRQGGGVASSVAFRHIAGTATDSVDYTAPASGVLDWGIGDTTPRFIDVPIIDDAVTEPVETFRLELFDPMATSITPIGLMEVRIQDNENGHIFRDGFDGPGCP